MEVNVFEFSYESQNDDNSSRNMTVSTEDIEDFVAYYDVSGNPVSSKANAAYAEIILKNGESHFVILKDVSF
jgi:hypothetical protein